MEFLSKLSKWENLRTVGKSKIVSFTILVPFVGYLILFNNELVTYLELYKDVLGIESGKPDDSFSRLYFLYLGLSTIGVSSALFSIFCPQQIKNNNTVHEFIDSEMKIVTHLRLDGMKNLFNRKHSSYSEVNDQYKNYNDSDEEILKTYPELIGAGVELKGKKVAELKELSAKCILDLVWSYHLNSFRGLRILILLVYTAGFTLILIPSGQVFLKVIRLLTS